MRMHVFCELQRFAPRDSLLPKWRNYWLRNISFPPFSFRLCTLLDCILFQKGARKSQLEHFFTYVFLVLEQTLRTVDLKYQPPPLNPPA